jgi:hypothetical protein
MGDATNEPVCAGEDTGEGAWQWHRRRQAKVASTNTRELEAASGGVSAGVSGGAGDGAAHAIETRCEAADG